MSFTSDASSALPGRLYRLSATRQRSNASWNALTGQFRIAAVLLLAYAFRLPFTDFAEHGLHESPTVTRSAASDQFTSRRDAAAETELHDADQTNAPRTLRSDWGSL